MQDTRISKYLSECGVCSRRKADELILEGKVRVNGRVVTELGAKIDPLRDRVQVRSRIVKPPEKGVLLLYKPRRVVSTLDDPQGRRTVKDFLTKHYRSYFPVGRLDYDTTGLLVLTNDGELADRLLHPRYGFRRVYEAKVVGHVTERTVQRVGRGIDLDDGRASAKIEIVENSGGHTKLRVEVYEGRNRLVRRLMEKVGHPVDKLRRVQHGPVHLGKMTPGEVRKLTSKEYESLRRVVFGSGESKPEKGKGFARPAQRPKRHRPR